MGYSKHYNWTKEEDNTLRTFAKTGVCFSDVCKNFSKVEPIEILIHAKEISGAEDNKAYDRWNNKLKDNTKNFSELYSRRGQKWEPAEDKYLTDHFLNRTSIYEMMEMLERSRASIVLRLNQRFSTKADLENAWNKIKFYLQYTLCGRKPKATEPAVKETEPKEEELTFPRYYRHFKGGKYKALMEGKDSETQEAVIIYQALYGEHGIWVRPKAMFFENVERDGYSGPRFTEITEEEATRE